MALSYAASTVGKTLQRSMLWKHAVLTSNFPLMNTTGHYQPSRSGGSRAMVVLFPEMPEDTAKTNTMLDVSRSFPDFSTITVKSMLRGAAKASLQYEIKISEFGEALSPYPSASNFAETLDELSLPVVYAMNTCNLLGVINSKAFDMAEVSKGVSQCQKALLERFNGNPPLRRAVINILRDNQASDGQAPSEGEQGLTATQLKLFVLFETELIRNGFLLENPQKKNFKMFFQELCAKNVSFFFNAYTTKEFFKSTLSDPRLVEEMPTDLKHSIAANPKHGETGPWLSTLHNPSYEAVMAYCPDPTVRYEAWHANRTLASPKFNDLHMVNNKYIEDILLNRYRLAFILGYASYADMVLQTHMSGSVDNVVNFIESMKNTFHTHAEEELASLQAFACNNGYRGLDLEMWDIPYYARLQQEKDYGITESLAEFFSYPAVLQSIFSECQNLFGITFKEKPSTGLASWQQEVKCYTVSDTKNGQVLGEFLLDSYERPGVKVSKDIHVYPLKPKDSLKGTPPSMYVSFNFPPPQVVDGKVIPSLLTPAGVKFLICQVGLLLEDLLMDSPYHELVPRSSFSYLDSDCRSVCSSVFEYLLFTPSFLSQCATHWDTGAKGLSDGDAQNLITGDRCLHAVNLMESLYLSAFDIEIHLAKNTCWMTCSERLWREYMLFPREKDESHETSLYSLFADPLLGCDQYGELWSNMLAADIVEDFTNAQTEEEKKLVGSRFRSTYLSGNARAASLFHQFKGKPPSMESYFRKFTK